MERTRTGSPTKMNQCIPRLTKPNAPKSKPQRLVPKSLLERFREALLRMIMLSAVTKSTHENIDRVRAPQAPCEQPGHARHQNRHHRQPSNCNYYQDRYYGEAVADCIEFIKKKASSDDCSSIAGANILVPVQVA